MNNHTDERDTLALMLKNDPGFFRTLIDALPIQIFVKDTKSRFVAANTATAKIIGAASVAELIGKTDLDFFPIEAWTEYQSDEQQLFATGKPIIEKEEPKIDKITGEKRLVWITKLPVRDKSGKIIGLVGFGNDMTERKHAEEKLQEERNSLRVLIDTLPDYIYVKDTQSRFIESNIAHAHHMHVKSPDDLLGKTDFDFYPKDIATSFYTDEQEIIRTGKPIIQKDEINSTLQDHTVRVLTTKIPLRDTKGRIIAIVGVGHDITKLSKMERNLGETHSKLGNTLNELKRTQDQIIENERMRALGQMASGITHDFNNALTPILGYSDLLLNGPDLLDDKATAINMLNDIRTAAIDASQTVRRLSEFYAPARKTERKTIDINKLIDSTLALTRPKWKEEMAAKGANIQVVSELNEVHNVYGNESQLREMLTNLIFNAVDAMPKGGTLTINVHNEAPFTVIKVTDTGMGMTEEVRQHCFEPFFTTKHKRGGGLGLSMVHGIIRQHEGNIDVESIEGKGTTFIIRLPEAVEPVFGEKTKVDKPVEIQQMKVLLIDDEEIVRQTVEACLKGDKHTVHTATDGNEGIALFRKEHFDIVITDRAMPGMSGDHVASEIKKINPNMPVIMLTGFGHVMKDLQQRPAGVDLIVSKPVTRDSLRDSLIKAVSHKKH
ncbi:MAG: PAS domain-containing protein [Kiritimatiellae bacterium]|nr:PAS domain-containing protein [Kiritimatiellia bacterium]MDD5521567.1 PAS domain-containing protein [Kiritimatiellia bacterium]